MYRKSWWLLNGGLAWRLLWVLWGSRGHGLILLGTEKRAESVNSRRYYILWRMSLVGSILWGIRHILGLLVGYIDYHRFPCVQSSEFWRHWSRWQTDETVVAAGQSSWRRGSKRVVLIAFSIMIIPTVDYYHRSSIDSSNWIKLHGQTDISLSHSFEVVTRRLCAYFDCNLFGVFFLAVARVKQDSYIKLNNPILLWYE